MHIKDEKANDRLECVGRNWNGLPRKFFLECGHKCPFITPVVDDSLHVFTTKARVCLKYRATNHKDQYEESVPHILFKEGPAIVDEDCAQS